MKRTLILQMLLALVTLARADSGINFTDWQGVASVSNTGIGGNASLICYAGIKAYNGHTLGSVIFNTGALTGGSVLNGGTFSSLGSAFTIIGNGMQRMHNGTVFSGAFSSPIQWTLLSQSAGTFNYALSGQIVGQLWSGRTTTGYTTQLISMSGSHAFLTSGRNSFGDGKLTTPEPDTLLMICTGMAGIAVLRRRLIGYKP